MNVAEKSKTPQILPVIVTHTYFQLQTCQKLYRCNTHGYRWPQAAMGTIMDDFGYV
jgi:hypothetical protein